MSKKKPIKLPEGVRLLDSGRYQARYPVTRVKDGKAVTVQVSAGTYDSISDAKDARNIALAQLRTGNWVDPVGPRTTVRDWSAQWLGLRRTPNRRTVSFLRSRIVPYWGDWRLGEITPLDVQRWVNHLGEQDLSPNTVRAMYATFKQMLSKAVDYDLLVKTPCRTIDLPAARKTELVKLGVEQVMLLEQSAPARFAAMIHLAAWGGLRWQEVAALRWANVDLQAGVVHVCEAVKESDGRVGSTKNGKDRWVPISPATVEMLRTHRRDFGSTELLFTGERDHRLLDYHSFMHHTWRPLVKACGIEPTGFHVLRHFHATQMVAQGMDWKVLSDRLGHHAPSFTADRYGWAREDHVAVSVAALERAMSGE